MYLPVVPPAAKTEKPTLSTEGPKEITITLELKMAKLFEDALADFSCWIDGFKAAGGTYAPQSEYVVKDLLDVLKRNLPD